MQKLAFYTSGDCYGGLEKNTLRFIEWLIEARYDILLLTPPGSTMGKLAEEKMIPVHYLREPSYYIDLRSTLGLVRFLKQNNIRLVMIIRPRDILMASIIRICFVRSLQLCFFQQSFLNLKKHPWLYKLLFKPFAAWISPARGLADKALALTHYNPEKMTIIPPCIDARHFASDTLTRRSARKLFDLPNDKLIIGAIGKYQNTYALDFYIRTIQFLNRNHHDVHLLIVGRPGTEREEEYRNFLSLLATECKVEDRVHFRSNKDKLVTFFRSIDIFVTNRQPQPYDLIIQKAMSSGLAVVVPYSEINTELLDKGNLGMLYHPKDLVDFSNKIIHLVTQPKLREHLQKEGRKAIFARYDRNVGCDKLKRVLNDIAEEA